MVVALNVTPCCETENGACAPESPGTCDCACCDRSLCFAPASVDAATAGLLDHAVDILASQLQFISRTDFAFLLPGLNRSDPPDGLPGTLLDRRCLLLI
jgi:hypothetical protein